MNLEELEAKYKELGAEIERLKAKPSKKRWRAKEGKKYWYLTAGCLEDTMIEDGDSFDDSVYATGNYFKTKEEAESLRDRLLAKQRIIDALREHEGDWVADWKDTNQPKWFVCIDKEQNILREEYYCYFQQTEIELISSKAAWGWVIENMESDIWLMMTGERK